jgi:hypothetical protein
MEKAMAVQTATKHDRRDAPRRTYWDLLDGWYANEVRDELTPNTRIVFGALLHMANRRFFPATMDVDKKALADLARVSRESVRRALNRLADADLVHLAVVPGRGRVLVGICYEALDGEAVVHAQPVHTAGVRAQIVQKKDAPNPSGHQSPRGSTATRPNPQVTDSRESPECRDRQLRVPEVGSELRDGDQCPKCQTHALRIRFKTDAGSRTKQRFLACSGYETGGCRGFTWNLGSSAYKPSQRVLSQALTGARHVPGRPALVRDMLSAAKRAEEPAPTTNTAPATLAEWVSKSGFLPLGLMLDSLGDVAPTLASHHRDEGSDKNAILRAVKARIAEDSR